MQGTFGFGFGSAVSLFAVGLLGAGLYGCPQYNVYEQTQSGKAKLAEANFSREIAVREAQAKMEAADLLANAEVKRAEGVAKANKIIGDSLKENEAYLRYLWIDKLEGAKTTTIYIPTEAGLPILEAGKR